MNGGSRFLDENRGQQSAFSKGQGLAKAVKCRAGIARHTCF
jgi:hypothetical protein